MRLDGEERLEQAPPLARGEEVTPPPPAREEDNTTIAEAMAAYLEEIPTLQPGKILRGRVVRIAEEGALVDVGQKSEGLIPRREMEALREELVEGQEIDVYVVQLEDEEGNLILSKRQADYILAWERLEEARARKSILVGTVVRAVRGGLVVDLGHLGQGFIPASEVDTRRSPSLDALVGEVVRVQVLEVDPEKKRVVLSRRSVLLEERRQMRQEVLRTLREGQIRRGVVRRLTDFGAFVDLGGGVEGLLHVSELAWTHVSHPQEVLKPGDEIEVMILKVERERNRISLGRRQLLPDPWKEVPKLYHEGDLVEGEVTRVVPSGAFVRLPNGVEGFARANELAERGTKPEEAVQPGQKLRFRILHVDAEARRVALSLRQAQQEASREEYGAYLEERERPISTVGDLYGEQLRSLKAQLLEGGEKTPQERSKKKEEPSP